MLMNHRADAVVHRLAPVVHSTDDALEALAALAARLREAAGREKKLRTALRYYTRYENEGDVARRALTASPGGGEDE